MKRTLTLFILTTVFSINLVYGQLNRPQTPEPPFDYKIEDVTFRNETDNIKLAGTLTTPKEGSNHPVVILISGSGPQDRNSELMGHKSFLVIADHFAKNGIATLRVDDRGTAETEGIYNETSLDGFVRDTEAAMAYITTQPEFASSKMGLIGHSLGGTIAPIIASTSDEIDFIVMLAGPGLRGDKLMLLQKELIERKMGLPDAMVEQSRKSIAGAYDIIIDERKTDSLSAHLRAYFIKAYNGALPENQLNALSQQMALPWLVDFIRHDPAPTLAKVKCPVLALNGTLDLQVPHEQNLEAIFAALKTGGNQQYETKTFENLNHLFQECKTGLPNEYGQIEQTFSPEVLEVMVEWILRR